MQGDGVFYMGAHGGQCTIAERDSAGNLRIDADGRAIGRSAFGIWTSSPFDPAIPNQYWSAIVAGQVGIGIARNSKTPPHNAARYFITSQFVRDLMKPFGADSLVCFGACHSMSAMSAAFAVELAAKNAGLVVGWSHVVDTFAIIAAYRFIFDRLLGDNSTNPKESPPQRPFDYEEVWADLKKHGLHLHPNSNGPVTEIRYHAGPGSFGLLAPSIQFVLINESADQAILKGIFGKPPPGERAVLIGGLEAAVVSWEKEEIVCTLPRSGTGSAGDVEVWVRGHKSNVRRITEWNIPMRFAFKDPDHPPLKVSGDVFLRFRADVGDYRSHTHEAPFQPIVGAVATRDSSASLMGSGSAVIDECTVSWLGEYEFPASGFGDPFASALVARFRVDTETKKGAVGLALLALPPVPLPFTIRSVCPDGSGEVKITVAFGELFGEELFPDPGNDPDRPEVPLPAVQISFDPANYSFPGGAFEDITTGLVRLEWDPVMPNFPPDPEAARVPALISAQQAG
jgi:hypothetical protein